MNSVPINEDADSSWKEMVVLLNQHLPVVELTSSNATLKTIVAKLASMLTYVLPAAAMITAGTYIVVPKIKENKKIINSTVEVQIKQNNEAIKALDTFSMQKDTLDKVVIKDSLSQPILEAIARKRSHIFTSIEESPLYTKDSLPQSIHKAKPRKRSHLTPSTEQLPLIITDTTAKLNIKPISHVKRVSNTVRKDSLPAKSISKKRKLNF